MFTKAQRERIKAKIAMWGPAKSGKTYSSLSIATGLGSRIALIDTENRSSHIYADDFEFDSLQLTAPFNPEKYIAAIEAAEKENYDVIIVDSLSPEWDGEGGSLFLVNELAESSKSKNTYTPWNKITPRHNALMRKIQYSSTHIICTCRTKMDYVLTGGVPKAVGLAPIQRNEFEYEFDILFSISRDHNLTVEGIRQGKTSNPLEGLTILKPTKELGKMIGDWLDAGVERPSYGYLDSQAFIAIVKAKSNLTETDIAKFMKDNNLLPYEPGKVDEYLSLILN